MPTFEFFGYDADQTDKLIAKIKNRLADISYRQDIVFVKHAHDGSKVVSWDNDEKPFVRILSRSSDKLTELSGEIHYLADVETVLIGYFQQAPLDTGL